MAKKQKGIPQGSPASSAPSTPRKSAAAERIAQEKARLKKLEHELSEKLKLYVRQDEGKSHSSVSPKKPSQNNKDISDVKRSEREEKQPSPDGAVSGNSTHPTSERPDVDSRGQSNQLIERQKAVASPKDSEKTDAMELNINAQQMERIRKLQVSTPMYTNCKIQIYQELHLHTSQVCFIICTCMNLMIYKHELGVNPAVYYPGGLEVLLDASCYKTRDKC